MRGLNVEPKPTAGWQERATQKVRRNRTPFGSGDGSQTPALKVTTMAPWRRSPRSWQGVVPKKVGLAYQHKRREKSGTQSNVCLFWRPTSFNTPQLLIKAGHWSIRDAHFAKGLEYTTHGQVHWLYHHHHFVIINRSGTEQLLVSRHLITGTLIYSVYIVWDEEQKIRCKYPHSHCW